MELEGYTKIRVNPILGCSGWSLAIPNGTPYPLTRYHHRWMIIDQNRRVVTSEQIPNLFDTVSATLTFTHNQDRVEYLVLNGPKDPFTGILPVRKSTRHGFFIRHSNLRYCVVDEGDFAANWLKKV